MALSDIQELKEEAETAKKLAQEALDAANEAERMQKEADEKINGGSSTYF